jgi:hypothetical protein
MRRIGADSLSYAAFIIQLEENLAEQPTTKIAELLVCLKLK